MDKKAEKKQRTKLNILDVLIIVAVVACIAAIGLRIYFSSRTETMPDEITVSFEVAGISAENAAEFKEGKTLYLQSGGEKIGKIETVSVSAQKIDDATDKDGNIVTVYHPEKKTVSGTVTLYGKESDNGFMIGGKTLMYYGSTIDVYTDRNVFTLTVNP